MRPLSETEPEAALVKSYCEKHYIPFFQKYAKLKDAMVSQTEDNYRRFRHQAFNIVCSQEKIEYVATGHHADDQLETILMKLCRGSGLRGLSGIAENKSTEMGFTFVRPLLDITKKDIYEICAENDVPYMEDSSNVNTDYTRNLLRAEIMPVLRKAFPGCSTRVNETARIIADAQDLVDRSTTQLAVYETDNRPWLGFSSQPLPECPWSVSIKIDALSISNDVVIYEWLRKSFYKVATLSDTPGLFDGLNKDMIDRVIATIRGKECRRFDWPCNVKVHINKTQVRLENSGNRDGHGTC
jgi:tRNA(Ile)-lysidine synthetase-like protein